MSPVQIHLPLSNPQLILVTLQITILLSLRNKKSWKIQQGNQNPYIEEHNTMAKRKGTKNDLQNIHIKLESSNTNPTNNWGCSGQKLMNV